MLKKWILIIAIFSMAGAIQAQENIDKYGDLEVKRLKNDGWFALLSEVSMVKESVLEQTFAEILRQCKITYRQSGPQVNECVEQRFDEYLDVPLADLRDWDNQRQLLENKNVSIDKQLKLLETRFAHISKKSKLTEADVQEIQQIAQQMSDLVLEKANATNQHTEGVLPYSENIINN